MGRVPKAVGQENGWLRAVLSLQVPCTWLLHHTLVFIYHSPMSTFISVLGSVSKWSQSFSPDFPHALELQLPSRLTGGMILEMFPKRCLGRYIQGWFEGRGRIAVSYTWEMEVEGTQSLLLTVVSPKFWGVDSMSGQ